MSQVADSLISLELRGQPVSRPVGKNLGESARLARRPGVAPKECYRNCFDLLHEVPGYERASYVEGYVVADNGFPFDHAWLVKDGFIVDPTLPVGIKRYAAGLEFVGVSGIETFLQTVEKKVGCLHAAFRHGGFTSPSYFRAFLDAFAEVPGFVPPPMVLAMTERSEVKPGEFLTVVEKA